MPLNNSEAQEKSMIYFHWLKCLLNSRRLNNSLPAEYANGQNRFREAVRHVSDYLSQATYLIRHNGVWTLTEHGGNLITALAEKGIDRIMKPGVGHWY